MKREERYKLTKEKNESNMTLGNLELWRYSWMVIRGIRGTHGCIAKQGFDVPSSPRRWLHHANIYGRDLVSRQHLCTSRTPVRFRPRPPKLYAWPSRLSFCIPWQSSRIPPAMLRPSVFLAFEKLWTKQPQGESHYDFYRNGKVH